MNSRTRRYTLFWLTPGAEEPHPQQSPRKAERMTEEAGKGAWMWRTTIGGDSDGKWEKYWDPDATPMSEAEAHARYRRILEILFAPRPDDP